MNSRNLDTDLWKNIIVEPQGTLHFHSTQYNTVATIKISSKDCSKSISKIQKCQKVPPMRQLPNYMFQLKTTNRKGYKVSQSKGQITQFPFTIGIFLRSGIQLEKHLKDEFKLTISLTKDQGRHPLQFKFKVSIEETAKKNQGNQITEIALSAPSTAEGSLQNPSSVFSSPANFKRTLMPYDSNRSKAIEVKRAIKALNYSIRGVESLSNANFKKLMLSNSASFGQQKEKSSKTTPFKERLINSITQVNSKRLQLNQLLKDKQKIQAKNRFKAYFLVFWFLLFVFLGFTVNKAQSKIQQQIENYSNQNWIYSIKAFFQNNQQQTEKSWFL